ncbi:MAG: DNA polymerase III subunit delta' [Planctomycetaceae bacterium]|nr:DNA polymerase III subunit delta' [Planctomycetaceae bacterium]
MTSVWTGFRGHDDVRQSFARAAERGRLTQSYLFVGPEGVGKQLFARRMAQCLLCDRRTGSDLEACGECANCRPFLAGNHPDFLMVERDPGKRELNVAKFVGDRDQRGKAGLCHDLSLRSSGSRKVAIINDADTMNDEAANALLKTLEEPPDGAMLILVASNLDSLLPTIRSRCQLVRFGPLSDADVADLALQEEWATSREDARQLALLAEGSLAAARRLAAPAFRELRLRMLRELSQPQWDGIAVAQSVTKEIEQLGSDTAEQRTVAVWLLKIAVEFYRAALWRLGSPDDNPVGATIAEANAWADRVGTDIDRGVDLIGRLIERCLEAVAQLEQNVGIALCLEALCTDLSVAARVATPSR